MHPVRHLFPSRIRRALSLLITFLMLMFNFPTLVACQNTSARIGGIGIGTLIIIIAICFSIIWCLACRNSSRPEFYSILGLLVPLVLILAFVFTPKASQVTTVSASTDGNYIPHIIFMVLSIIGFLFSAIAMVFQNSFVYRKAKNVARSAFTKRIEADSYD